MATEPDNKESIVAIRDWMAHPVTRHIWEQFKKMAEDGDRSCHAMLSKGNNEEASNWNAYCDALREVIELPAELIAEKKEWNS